MDRRSRIGSSRRSARSGIGFARRSMTWKTRPAGYSASSRRRTAARTTSERSWSTSRRRSPSQSVARIASNRRSGGEPGGGSLGTHPRTLTRERRCWPASRCREETVAASTPEHDLSVTGVQANGGSSSSVATRGTVPAGVARRARCRGPSGRGVVGEQPQAAAYRTGPAGCALCAHTP